MKQIVKHNVFVAILIFAILTIVSCCPSKPKDTQSTNKQQTPIRTEVKTSKIFIPKAPNGYSQLIVNVVNETGEGIAGAIVYALCPNDKEKIQAKELSDGIYYITLPDVCFTGGYISASKPTENRAEQTKVLAYKRSSVNFVLLKK